jgi:hypothetical protein
MKAFFITCSLLLTSIVSFTQALPDSIIREKTQPKQTLQSALWVSVPLISLGFIANGNSSLLNKYEFKEERDEKFGSFHTHIDDYLQYSSIAAMYGMNALGIRGKHDVRFQTIVLLKAELLMTAIVTPLKRITHVMRPDSSGYSSFPSGHTAQAFLGAEMLRKEYGKDHPWVAVGGYVTASAVGALRMLNNKHWLPDIIAGAGIGILSVNIIYCTQKWKNPKNKMTFSPTYSASQPGFYMAYVF